MGMVLFAGMAAVQLAALCALLPTLPNTADSLPNSSAKPAATVDSIGARSAHR
jgi:hypothetical protein